MQSHQFLPLDALILKKFWETARSVAAGYKCWLKGLHYWGQLQISTKGKHKGSVNVKRENLTDVIKYSWEGTVVGKRMESFILFQLWFY